MVLFVVRLVQRLYLVCAVLLAAACASQPVVQGQGPDGYSEAAPPVEQVETVAVVPRPGQVWIKGRWTRRHGQWLWVNGHWTGARAGWTYVPGRWQPSRRGYIWVEGYWRRA
jgi:WXXGXW repeat (2 copies)